MSDAPTAQQGFPGAIRLFQFRGITVFLHWAWAVLAVIAIQGRRDAYEAPIWGAAEYLTLFAIVLLHEFGHALACRSVGGRADRILLWPLGGVAYVDPPRRPGAVLWSIAAGPLVNVALIPVTIGAIIGIQLAGWNVSADFDRFLEMVATINIVLLCFNMLPIYPLDGGQILQSILWFFVGLPRSLTIAAGIGFIGAAGVILLAIVWGDMWLIILAIFGLSRSWAGLVHAQRLKRLLALPRHPAYLCPECHEAPPRTLRPCPHCGREFDLYDDLGVCPWCGLTFRELPCVFCSEHAPPGEWVPSVEATAVAR